MQPQHGFRRNRNIRSDRGGRIGRSQRADHRLRCRRGRHGGGPRAGRSDRHRTTLPAETAAATQRRIGPLHEARHIETSVVAARAHIQAADRTPAHREPPQGRSRHRETARRRRRTTQGAEQRIRRHALDTRKQYGLDRCQLVGDRPADSADRRPASPKAASSHPSAAPYWPNMPKPANWQQSGAL